MLSIRGDGDDKSDGDGDADQITNKKITKKRENHQNFTLKMMRK